MAFTKSYITEDGLALLTKLETLKENLVISSVVGASGLDNGIPPSEMTEVPFPPFQFQTLQGVLYNGPNQIVIPLYYENSQQLNSISLTEIGLYADDPEGGTVLLAVSTSYDQPMPLPRFAEGRLELTIGFLLEFSLTEDITIELPSSVVYLTRPEAMKLFWIIGEKYPATEITESVGRTTEEHQRWQDDRLNQILTMLESGSTAGTVIDKPTRLELPRNWRIRNYSGWRDGDVIRA